jgi:hypothetical protein
MGSMLSYRAGLLFVEPKAAMLAKRKARNRKIFIV